jgi:hypothetical protein
MSSGDDKEQELWYEAPAGSVLSGIVYRSSIRGVTQVENDAKISYWGKTIRIPNKYVGTDRQAEFEIDPATLIQQIPEQGEVIPGGWAERYDFWDVETKDLIVVWRIPFKPHSQKKE